MLLLDGVATSIIMEADTKISSCVCGYHVYKDIWAAAICELVTCTREPANAVDRYAVAVLREEPYGRRCDVHSGISGSGTCYNTCSEHEKIRCSKYPYGKFFIVD